MERGENRRQPRPGEERTKKNRGTPADCSRPVESGSRHSKRRRVSSVSRPRFISGGSVSEARLGVKWLQVV